MVRSHTGIQSRSERNHRVLNEYSRSYIKDTDDWEGYIKCYTFCYNTSHHTTLNTQYSPYEVIFGKTCKIPTELNKTTIDPIYNVENYAKEIKYRMQKVNKTVKEMLTKAKAQQKKYYDKNTNPIELKVRDKVLLINQSRHKLKPMFKGPYEVLELMESNVKILDMNTNEESIVHKNNIRKNFT